jgi:hypothetical protein
MCHYNVSDYMRVIQTEIAVPDILLSTQDIPSARLPPV